MPGPYSTISRYESDGGTIYPIRIQPETTLATFGGVANTSPAGAVNAETSAKVSGGKRQFGMNARGVYFRVTVPAGDSEIQAGSILRLPVLRQSVWAGIPKAAAVAYDGHTGVITGKYGESAK